MSHQTLKKLISIFTIFIILTNTLIPILGPVYVRAEAPPPPTAPILTPSPADQTGASGLSIQSLPAPGPNTLPSEAEEIRARQAMDIALAKYRDYYGPRSRLDITNFGLEDGWAYAVVTSDNQAKLHLLAKRLPDGSWQVLLPDGDNLYLQWIEAMPESLVSAGDKEQLRQQADAAITQRHPSSTVIAPPPITSTLPSHLNSLPVFSLAVSTTTPTPVLGQVNRLTNTQSPSVTASIAPLVTASNLPPDQPERGLIYTGLELAAADDPCQGLYKISGTEYCTHGPDPAPPGVNIKVSALPADPPSDVGALAVQCDGDGSSGKRVQVIYARASDRSDRYSTYLTSFRQWAAEADAIYQDSAAATGGTRHIRFVHDAGCTPVVLNVVLSPAGDDNISNTINELKALGYDRSDRKYMIFMDATVLCGQGNIMNDDQPGAANANNGGPSYGRTDAGCWSGEVPAHELMHNLGGVQMSAPHTSGGWHCVDEYDRMCYSDSPYYPSMQYICSGSSNDRLFDCNHDDYYNTSPPANSYLTTHWNAANSQYLITGNGGGAQVELFALANYQNLVWSGGLGFSNGPSSNSFSMNLPGGWSVWTWKQDNRAGEARCWFEPVPNLQDHTWHLAIQSIEVFDTNVCPPAVPTGVSASDGTYTDRVRLTWNTISGATSYLVYRATSASGTKTYLGSVTSTTYDDFSATTGTTYYYFVRASSSYGTSDYSAYNTGWRNGTAPSAPTGVSASDGTYTDRVRVTWNAASRATSYPVYRATSAGGTKTYLGSATNTAFDDFSAATGTTHYYFVRASNSYGTSGYSAYDTGWRNGTAPSAPANVQASDGIYSNKVRVTWNTASGATSYLVYRATSAGGTKTYLGSATNTSYDDFSAAFGITYYYFVRASNTYGTSGYSAYDTGWRNSPSQPDLLPAQWTGWQYPIVPASITGTTEVNSLYANLPTYIDWGVANSSNSDSGGDVYGDLYLDSARLARYNFGNILANQSWAFFDWTETVNTPGWHTLKVIADPNNLIAESDETNNVWERQFYWTPIAPYADDMEDGLNDWTATGLWHQIDENSPYPASHSGSHSWWYGQDGTGDYDTGTANSGDLTSPPIYIPTYDYYLRFWYRYETEMEGPNWDQRRLQISVDGGPFSDVLQLYDDPMNWWLQSPAINLSGYAGYTIQVRFRFDTLDGAYNAYQGWHIDDFDISGTPPPSCINTYEPNNTPAQASAIAYGQTLSADICPGGDYDYYRFTGAAGDKIVVDIDAQINGSSLDPYIFLLDGDGTTVLSANDDEILSEIRDSRLGYELPNNGLYYIKVKAWDHPSAGGSNHFYTINLSTDNTGPSFAQITSPSNDAWLDLSQETITVSASDNESGIKQVKFWWHDNDWENSDWVLLGTDWDGRDGWSLDFDTSSLAEQQGASFYIYAYDWTENYTGHGVWNLGLDRTPPTVSAEIWPLYGDAPFLDFRVSWGEASDNMSGIASFDVQYRDGPTGIWINLLTGTTSAYTRFVGQNGHTYYFRARARDRADNQSAYAGGDGDAQHTVQISVVAADIYEIDNSKISATTVLTDGTWQAHNFHTAGDQDWLKFTAAAGVTYTLVTTNTGGHSDTVIYLYDSDGTTLIGFNDDDPDNWPASRLEWGATHAGVYYIRIEHWDPYAYGSTTAYALSIAETGTFEVANNATFVPIILK